MDHGAGPTEGTDGGFDAGTYGRSFADVYDDWYPDDDATAAAVALVVGLCGAGGRVLELGVGTGRLALPLAAAGLEVTGLDASPEMLERLRDKDPDGSVRTVTGDVGDAAAWPEGPFDVVLAACNLICNLADAGDQEACVRTSASRLRPGGRLVVEAFVPAPLQAGRHVEVTEVRGDVVVMIATESDPTTGVVTAQHVELRDGAPVRLRPWRIRVASPAEIDTWAARAGLECEERHADWSGSAFDPVGASQVTLYRRPLSPGG
jgi:SAM-dependent methyltransferase